VDDKTKFHADLFCTAKGLSAADDNGYLLLDDKTNEEILAEVVKPQRLKKFPSYDKNQKKFKVLKQE